MGKDLNKQPHTIGALLNNLVEIHVKGLVEFPHKPLFTKDSAHGAIILPIAQAKKSCSPQERFLLLWLISHGLLSFLLSDASQPSLLFCFSPVTA